jgi:hypothetical protein
MARREIAEATPAPKQTWQCLALFGHRGTKVVRATAWPKSMAPLRPWSASFAAPTDLALVGRVL